MSNKRPTPPTHKAITDAHFQNGLFTKLRWPISLESAVFTCWACAYIFDGKALLTRAHVQAFSNEGTNAPLNFILLCHLCHLEQPDGLTVEAQIQWLRSRSHWTTTFAKTWTPVVEAIQAAAALHGGDSALARFNAEVSKEEVFAHYQNAMVSAAGSGGGNAQATGRWSLVELFKKWAAGSFQAPPAVPADQSSSLATPLTAMSAGRGDPRQLGLF